MNSSSVLLHVASSFRDIGWNSRHFSGTFSCPRGKEWQRTHAMSLKSFCSVLNIHSWPKQVTCLSLKSVCWKVYTSYWKNNKNLRINLKTYLFIDKHQNHGNTKHAHIINGGYGAFHWINHGNEWRYRILLPETA